jgi:hypothetical protein
MLQDLHLNTGSRNNNAAGVIEPLTSHGDFKGGADLASSRIDVSNARSPLSMGANAHAQEREQKHETMWMNGVCHG